MRTNVMRAPCRRHLDDRAETKIPDRIGDMTIANNKVHYEEQEFRLHHKFCSVCTRPGDSMDSKLTTQNRNQLRRRREVFENSYFQKKSSRSIVHGPFSAIIK